MTIKKPCKIFLIPLVALSLAGCIDKSEQVVKQVNHSQQRPSTYFPESANYVYKQRVFLAHQETQNFQSQVQTLESQFLDANSFQPELERTRKEIAALQEKLKNTENQLSNVEKKMLSTIAIDNSDTFHDDIWIALIDKNLQLHDNLSEFKQDLRTLDLKYQHSQQKTENLKMEIAANQKIKYPHNSKK